MKRKSKHRRCDKKRRDIPSKDDKEGNIQWHSRGEAIR